MPRTEIFRHIEIALLFVALLAENGLHSFQNAYELLQIISLIIYAKTTIDVYTEQGLRLFGFVAHVNFKHFGFTTITSQKCCLSGFCNHIYKYSFIQVPTESDDKQQVTSNHPFYQRTLRNVEKPTRYQG